MVAFVDARVVKNSYKGGDYNYVVEVGYDVGESETIDGEIVAVLKWSEYAGITERNQFNTLDAAVKFRDNLLNRVLVSREVVDV